MFLSWQDGVPGSIPGLGQLGGRRPFWRPYSGVAAGQGAVFHHCSAYLGGDRRFAGRLGWCLGKNIVLCSVGPITQPHAELQECHIFDDASYTSGQLIWVGKMAL